MLNLIPCTADSPLENGQDADRIYAVIYLRSGHLVPSFVKHSLDYICLISLTLSLWGKTTPAHLCTASPRRTTPAKSMLSQRGLAWQLQARAVGARSGRTVAAQAAAIGMRDLWNTMLSLL